MARISAQLVGWWLHASKHYVWFGRDSWEALGMNASSVGACAADRLRLAGQRKINQSGGVSGLKQHCPGEPPVGGRRPANQVIHPPADNAAKSHTPKITRYTILVVECVPLLPRRMQSRQRPPLRRNDQPQT